MTYYTFSARFPGRLLSLALLVCILLPLGATAQAFRLGFRGGASFSNFIGHNNSTASVTSDAGTGVPVFSPTPVGSPVQMPVIRPEDDMRYYYKTNLIKDMRTGFYGGLFLEIMLDRHWSLEPGISYVQKGIALRYATSYTPRGTSGGVGTYSFNRVIHTDYIVLPFAVKYNLGIESRFYVVAGFYEALAVRTRIINGKSETYTGSVSLNEPTATYSITTLNELKTGIVDFGVTGGGGVQWPLSSRLLLGVDVRANVGLMRLRGESGDGDYGGFSGKSRNLGIESGVRVGWKLMSGQD